MNDIELFYELNVHGEIWWWCIVKCAHQNIYIYIYVSWVWKCRLVVGCLARKLLAVLLIKNEIFYLVLWTVVSHVLSLVRKWSLPHWAGGWHWLSPWRRDELSWGMLRGPKRDKSEGFWACSIWFIAKEEKWLGATHNV